MFGFVGSFLLELNRDRKRFFTSLMKKKNVFTLTRMQQEFILEKQNQTTFKELCNHTKSRFERSEQRRVQNYLKKHLSIKQSYVS